MQRCSVCDCKFYPEDESEEEVNEVELKMCENHNLGVDNLTTLLKSVRANTKSILHDFTELTKSQPSDTHIVTRNSVLFVYEPSILKIATFFPQVELEMSNLLEGKNFCVPVIGSTMLQNNNDRRKVVMALEMPYIHLAPMPEDINIIAQCAWSLIVGVKHIHDKKMIHGNISPKKVHYCPDLDVAVLIGFGCMDRTQKCKPSELHFESTPGFTSPEVLHGQTEQYDYTLDVWSCGAMIMYWLFGSSYMEEDFKICSMSKSKFLDTFWEIGNKSYPNNKSLVGHLLNLVYSMICLDPENRTTLNSAAISSCFKNIEPKWKLNAVAQFHELVRISPNFAS